MSNGDKSTAMNPFGSTKVAAATASAIADAAAAREVAEIQGAMLIARRFPRDQKLAMDRILQACTRKSLAEEATFQYARGGTDIAAPSIRLAEAIAQNWGNLECGVKEMSRIGQYSEVMAYAVDLETGFRDSKVFQVKHWRDTKSGGYAITDERDIYELIANMAARRKRACILTVIPGDVVDTAMDQIEVTMRADIEITEETINKMLDAMEKFGVSKEMIEKRIQRRLGVETLSPALYLNLKRIYQSMKDGMSGPAEWFEMAPSDSGTVSGTEDQNTTAVRAAAAARAAREATERKAREESDTNAEAARAEAERKQRETESKAKTEAEKKASAEAKTDKKEKKTDAKPAPADAPTAAVKAKIIEKLKSCKDTDTLTAAADEANLIKGWTDDDRKEITAAYLSRLEWLEAPA